MAIIDGVDRQNYISNRIPLPVDVVADSTYVNSISGESVALYYFNSTVPTADAGQAAGTVVIAKLKYTGVLDRMGAMIGNDLETSLAWTTGTVLPAAKMKPCPVWAIEALDNKTLYEIATDVVENFASGEWCLDHRHGVIYGKKATTGTGDTAAYKVQTPTTSGTLSSAVNLTQIGGIATKVDDAAFTPATDAVLPTGFMADETTPDSVNEGDIGIARMTLTRKQINASDFLEDTAHTDGDYGTQVLAVRKDTGAAIAGSDGDYSPLQVDATGNLRVTGSVAVSATAPQAYGIDATGADTYATIVTATAARTHLAVTLGGSFPAIVTVDGAIDAFYIPANSAHTFDNVLIANGATVQGKNGTPGSNYTNLTATIW